MRRIVAAGALLALVACAAETVPTGAPSAPRERANALRSPRTPAREPSPPREVDPRRGGFDVVLGEWAVTPEAPAIRPGKVTFVVHNRGTMGHGYEMELEGDSSGPGSGDLFEAESDLVGPGETTRLTVTLAPGLYEIECLVDGHDDMGMEGVLEVRAGAPLVAAEEPRLPGRVSIEGFSFVPATTTVEAGTEVVWLNDDTADHTVTGAGAGFGSDVLSRGDSFSHRFEEPGLYEYACSIHPDMTGKVKVE